MSMVLQAAVEGKGHEFQSQIEELQGFIRTAAATGLAVHEVEQGLFTRLLALGYQFQRWFFALLGDGEEARDSDHRCGTGAAPFAPSPSPVLSVDLRTL